MFHDFIFGEPIKSIGTTCCIWRENKDTAWQRGNIAFPDDAYGDGSADLLYILDNNPQTYKRWAEAYYEEQFESRKLPLDTVKHIYELRPINKNIVRTLNPELDDLVSLKRDLDEINYPHQGL